jgi:RNA-directed DNA polymerase
MMDTNVNGKVQRVQAMLYAKASDEPETRFKRLYKYLSKPEWIEAAADSVLRKRGSRTAGVDGKTRKDYLSEDNRRKLVEAILDELATETYRPLPVRRTYVPKANGKRRPLGIATIKDRVVQQQAKMVIEPIYEATFLSCSYGFRPNRCTWDALAEAYEFLKPQCQYYTVIEGDIRNCFGTINHSILMRQLQRRIRDVRLLELVWKMLRTGVMENLQYAETTEGAPQGSIVSPVLANVYMHKLDEWMHHRFHAMTPQERYARRRKGELVAVRYIRYADDWIVLMRDSEKAEELKRELADFIRLELKMTLSEEKTAITQASEGFDFLGVRTFIAPQRSNPDKILPYQIPSKKSVKAYRQKVKELTHRSLDYLSPGERIKSLNWLIQGWANYHRWGNAKEIFANLGYWTSRKVYTMLQRYTPGKRREAYARYLHPVSKCANLRRWNKYTNWRTPSVKVGENTCIGLLPMAIIATSVYWRFRGRKIPPAYRLPDDETLWNERETEFYTDMEAIEGIVKGQMSRRNTEKYGQGYYHNRKRVLQRDRYTCTVCGYKSQRRKGDVHDLEVHHINPDGDYDVDNLCTVCLPCHHRLTASEQAD